MPEPTAPPKVIKHDKGRADPHPHKVRFDVHAPRNQELLRRSAPELFRIRDAQRTEPCIEVVIGGCGKAYAYGIVSEQPGGSSVGPVCIEVSIFDAEDYPTEAVVVFESDSRQ